jgi:hypothetical protein
MIILAPQPCVSARNVLRAFTIHILSNSRPRGIRVRKMIDFHTKEKVGETFSPYSQIFSDPGSSSNIIQPALKLANG